MLDKAQILIVTPDESQFNSLKSSINKALQSEFYQLETRIVNIFSLDMGLKFVGKYKEAVALILVDLSISSCGSRVNDLDTYTRTNLKQVEQSLIQFKERETQVIYFGSEKEEREARLILSRASDINKIIIPDSDKAMNVIINAFKFYIGQTSAAKGGYYAQRFAKTDADFSYLRTKVDEIESDLTSVKDTVTLLDRKVFYFDDQTTSPPLAQRVITLTQLGASAAKERQEMSRQILETRTELIAIKKDIKELIDWKNKALARKKKILGISSTYADRIVNGVVMAFVAFFMSLILK